MFNLTPAILCQVAPSMPTAIANQVTPLLTAISPKYRINTADIFHEFIATVLHESSCFTRLSENLNYSTSSLLKVFGLHRITSSEATLYGRNDTHAANEQEIANCIYGGEWGKKNLGNTEANDGWIFKGGGPIQMTGRSNFTDFSKYYNKLCGAVYSPSDIAQLVRKDMAIGIHSACWIFSISKNLIDLAISDNMKEITRRINGGYIGVEERLQYFERAKKFIREL